MKEVLDFIMLGGFVAFLIYIMRGFILQVQDKDDEKKIK